MCVVKCLEMYVCGEVFGDVLCGEVFGDVCVW